MEPSGLERPLPSVERRLFVGETDDLPPAKTNGHWTIVRARHLSSRATSMTRMTGCDRQQDARSTLKRRQRRNKRMRVRRQDNGDVFPRSRQRDVEDS